MEQNRILKTDNETDLMYSFLANSNKINPNDVEEMRENRDRKIINNIKDIQEELEQQRKKQEDEIAKQNHQNMYNEYSEHISKKHNTQKNDIYKHERHSLPSKTNQINRSPYKRTITPQKSHQHHLHEYKREFERQSYNPPPQPQPPSPKKEENVEVDNRSMALDYYTKLMALKKRDPNVVLNKHFSRDSNSYELKKEYEFQYELRDRQVKTKLYKNSIINLVHFIETANETYDPFSIDLDKWGEHVAIEIDDYDDIMNELYDKYKEIGKNLPPEIRLIFSLGFSGFTYHVSKKMFKNDGVEEILKDETAKQKITNTLNLHNKINNSVPTEPTENLAEIHNIINKQNKSFVEELDNKISEIPKTKMDEKTNEENYEYSEEDLEAMASLFEGTKQKSYINDEIMKDSDNLDISIDTSMSEAVSKSSSLPNRHSLRTTSQKKKNVTRI